MYDNNSWIQTGSSVYTIEWTEWTHQSQAQCGPKLFTILLLGCDVQWNNWSVHHLQKYEWFWCICNKTNDRQTTRRRVENPFTLHLVLSVWLGSGDAEKPQMEKGNECKMRNYRHACISTISTSLSRLLGLIWSRWFKIMIGRAHSTND